MTIQLKLLFQIIFTVVILFISLRELLTSLRRDDRKRLVRKKKVFFVHYMQALHCSKIREEKRKKQRNKHWARSAARGFCALILKIVFAQLLEQKTDCLQSTFFVSPLPLPPPSFLLPHSTTTTLEFYVNGILTRWVRLSCSTVAVNIPLPNWNIRPSSSPNTTRQPGLAAQYRNVTEIFDFTWPAIDMCATFLDKLCRCW